MRANYEISIPALARDVPRVFVAAVAGAQCTWTDWWAGQPLTFELDVRAPNWRLEIRSGRPLVIDAGCGPDHPEWTLSVVRGDARGPYALLEHVDAFACSPATKKRRQEARPTRSTVTHARFTANHHTQTVMSVVGETGTARVCSATTEPSPVISVSHEVKTACAESPVAPQNVAPGSLTLAPSDALARWGAAARALCAIGWKIVLILVHLP